MSKDTLIERYLGTMDPSEFESLSEIHNYFTLSNLVHMFGDEDFEDRLDAKDAVIESWLR